MKRELTLKVGDKHSGTRLDVFLAKGVDEISRSKAKRLIDDGMITVDGEKAKAHRIVHRGETVHITFPPPKEPSVEPEDIPLDIIHEDEKIIVINKRPGMVIHPAAGNLSHTLVNALVGRDQKLSEGTHPLRPGIVHRLDKETSGCLVVAKDDVTHSELASLFAGRGVEKEYRAIVAGNVRDDEGEIRTLIDRSRHDRKKMAVALDKGREAVTHYSVIQRYGPATYVSAFPKTGRTHQIRVHMAHLRHPILGDAQYSRRKTEKMLGIEVPRHMLHAWRIGFVHPGTGESVRFEAPLPEDFLEVMKKLEELSESGKK
jgi:23S rRNA pseudouridine1911/1915/1917 synthase